MSRVGRSAVLLSSLMACVGTHPLQDNQPCPCAPGWTCNLITNLCVQNGTGTGGAGGVPVNPPHSAADVQAALAQCDLAHGSVVAPATYAELRTMMVGAWLDCPPAVQTVFAPAIAFAADGTWQRLLSDGNGGLVPGYGLLNQGVYQLPLPDTQAATTGDYCVTYRSAGMGFTMNEYSEGSTTFEASPTRMHVTSMYNYQSYDVWLVPLPNTGNPP